MHSCLTEEDAHTDIPVRGFKNVNIFQVDLLGRMLKLETNNHIDRQTDRQTDR